MLPLSDSHASPPVVAPSSPWVVPAILSAGIVSAMNIGKLPPALPVLREALGISLVQASYLVSVFQLAGMTLGLFGGLVADRFGPRRVMLFGLGLLALASAGGAFATGVQGLLGLRALESAGFILAVLPGPALLRRSVPITRLSGALGGWGCYMPTGMATMLWLTPWLLAGPGWPAAWALCATLALASLAWIATVVPPDPPGRRAEQAILRLARDTLRVPGPWWLAACFGLYAAQFIVVFSFLPSVYQAAGVGAATAGLLSALGVAVNVSGNLSSGLLLTRGLPRHRLILLACAVMAVGACVGFDDRIAFGWRYGAILAFSAAGGLIPGTLFATAPRFAPHAGAVSTTTGLMQQGSAAGQFVAPPLIAALVSASGQWTVAGWSLAGFALANMLVALGIGRHDRQLASRAAPVEAGPGRS